MIVSIAMRPRWVALTRPAIALVCLTDVSSTPKTASRVIVPIAIATISSTSVKPDSRAQAAHVHAPLLVAGAEVDDAIAGGSRRAA